MIINWMMQRPPSENGCTISVLFIEGADECYILEDEVREVPGRPVSEWKIQNVTAIPAGRYRITLENSPRFGPNTLTVNNVPGFTGVRIHGGNKAADTDGCLLVGDNDDWDAGTISGAERDGVLARLKAKTKAAIDAGHEVWLDISNT